MKVVNNQRGISTLGLLTVLLVASFFMMCAAKMLPLYLQAWTVKNTIERTIEDGALSGKSPSAIRSALGRSFTVNQVDAISLKDVKIARTKTGVDIDASYEVRQPLIYNIDFVLRFDMLKFRVAAGSSPSSEEE